MNIPQKIAFASNNKGKIAEVIELFKPFNIEIIPQAMFIQQEANEPYCTFLENALAKARFCSQYSNLPTIADDSGLCVNALNGAPGVHSARYCQENNTDIGNMQKLIQNLHNVEDKSAYFYSVIVFIRHCNDPQPIFADGKITGEIVLEPHGNNGFGYDPIFYLPQYNKTMAQLDLATKNQISHRKMAFTNLISKFYEDTK
jgi:XTP/dITP diphosphohydrolase